MRFFQFKQLRLTIFILALLPNFIFPVSSSAYERPNRPTNGGFPYKGLPRKYVLHVPRSYTPGARVPLLVALHGENETGSEFETITGFDRVSAEHGFIVVYPDAFEKFWNDGRVLDNHRATHDQIDDVGFIAQLVAQLSSQYSIDASRIYVTGYSNGALLTLRLACELPGLFAGIVPVMGTFPEAIGRACEPNTPVSVMMINSTHDPLFRFYESQLRVDNHLLSVEVSARLWARANGCRDQPEFRTVRDADVNGPWSVREGSYRGCSSSTEVELLALLDSGHAWPKSSIPPLARLFADRGLGLSIRDGSLMIWQFLERQRRAVQPSQ